MWYRRTRIPYPGVGRGMTDEIGSAWCDVGTIGSIGRRIAGGI